MDSLAMSMAKQELNDPNSMYYAGEPSVSQQIRSYMNGISPAYTGPGSLGKRVIYPGQPSQDRFELASDVAIRRKQEAMFLTAAGGALAFVGCLIARKIPVINLIPRAVVGVLKLGWNVIAGLGKGLYKLIK